MSDSSSCTGGPDEVAGMVGLRIGAIFIIGFSSLATTLFPVVTKRVPKLAIPEAVFNFAKYFGSGVIIATAFIHLLGPGVEELGSPCLNKNFQNYPFALAFSMIAMFVLFFVELISFRIGAGLASKLAYDPHVGGHHHANEHAIPRGGPVPSAKDEEEIIEQSADSPRTMEKSASDEEVGVIEPTQEGLSAAASEILGVMILEFGVIFHSVIIGITLGTTQNDQFTTLFIVLIFHQAFEGLGLGTRLAVLPLPKKSWIPFIGGLAYAWVTPIGIAIGLGIRSTYNGN
ncbi:Zinc/iron permease, partial [Meira miltonrushii]